DAGGKLICDECTSKCEVVANNCLGYARRMTRSSARSPIATVCRWNGSRTVRARLRLSIQPACSRWVRCEAAHVRGTSRPLRLPFSSGLRLSVAGYLGAPCVEGLGHARKRGTLENISQRERQPKTVAYTREHLGGQQRVASQVEKVVVAAHALDMQHFAPDGGQSGFHRTIRSDIRQRLSARLLRNRERAPIDFAVRGARQVV